MSMECDLMPWIICKGYTHQFNRLQISQMLCIYTIRVDWPSANLLPNFSKKYNTELNWTMPLWVHVVFLFSELLTDNFLTVITSGHLSRNRDLAVSIPAVTMSQYVCRGYRANAVNLKVVRDRERSREEETLHSIRAVRCHCCNRPL